MKEVHPLKQWRPSVLLSVACSRAALLGICQKVCSKTDHPQQERSHSAAQQKHQLKGSQQQRTRSLLLLRVRRGSQVPLGSEAQGRRCFISGQCFAPFSVVPVSQGTLNSMSKVARA